MEKEIPVHIESLPLAHVLHALRRAYRNREDVLSEVEMEIKGQRVRLGFDMYTQQWTCTYSGKEQYLSVHDQRELSRLLRFRLPVWGQDAFFMHRRKRGGRKEYFCEIDGVTHSFYLKEDEEHPCWVHSDEHGRFDVYFQYSEEGRWLSRVASSDLPGHVVEKFQKQVHEVEGFFLRVRYAGGYYRFFEEKGAWYMEYFDKAGKKLQQCVLREEGDVALLTRLLEA